MDSAEERRALGDAVERHAERVNLLKCHLLLGLQYMRHVDAGEAALVACVLPPAVDPSAPAPWTGAGATS